ncbi:hypothetical protein [Kitasatospora phosalacinea]|uniref:HEAT repeat domain-containing protein n=1 Tax=Kitasatospora phosalacinea TaxID=2065 RepID=A0ABW6GKL7_9ACTN
MDSESREACVAALVVLAGSEDHVDRADAGQALARFAEVPAAARTLTALLVDPQDTHVTLETARALLRRGDRTATEIIAAALADAEPWHDQYVYDAVREVPGLFAEDHAEAVRLAGELTAAPDARLAKGATALRGMLDEVQPVFGLPVRPPDGPTV